MTGPDMGYSSGDLRSGAGVAGDAAGSADEAAAGLLGVAVPGAAAFGQVAGAAVLAAAVVKARDGQARVGAGVADGLRARQAGAQATAGQGDRLTGTTTTLATVPGLP